MVDNVVLGSLRRFFEARPQIKLAILFGSVADETARFDSDIDLAVSADRPLEAEEKMRLIEELAKLSGRPVDLIDLTQVGEPLLGRILVHGRRILGSDNRYAALLSRHLLEQADFVPYQRRILEERRRRWIGM